MFYTLLAAILMTAPIPAVKETVHKMIKVEELKSQYDQHKPIVVLDARTKPYFDGQLLPQAKWLPSDSSEEAILAAVPNKDSQIVVYCAGVKCPASGWLYDKLQAMGYHNVSEYHEGLQEWVEKGYPTTR